MKRTLRRYQAERRRKISQQRSQKRRAQRVSEVCWNTLHPQQILSYFVKDSSPKDLLLQIYTGVTTLTDAVSGESQNCSGNLKILPGIGRLGKFSGRNEEMKLKFREF